MTAIQHGKDITVMMPRNDGHISVLQKTNIF